MKKFLVLLLVLLVGWVLADLYRPVKTDFRHFDPAEVGHLDAVMWRSYYERRPVQLFLQLASLMRTQFGAPFWRSYGLAYRAAKAAFVFKDGKNRMEYARAMPDLQRFYAGLSGLSTEPFDADFVAKQELKWWIIRRERDRHPPAEWERTLADEAAALYHVPAARFGTHARLRVQAMLHRDALGPRITEKDWWEIDALLRDCWLALHEAVKKGAKE